MYSLSHSNLSIILSPHPHITLCPHSSTILSLDKLIKLHNNTSWVYSYVCICICTTHFLGRRDRYIREINKFYDWLIDDFQILIWIVTLQTRVPIAKWGKFGLFLFITKCQKLRREIKKSQISGFDPTLAIAAMPAIRREGGTWMKIMIRCKIHYSLSLPPKIT